MSNKLDELGGVGFLLNLDSKIFDVISRKISSMFAGPLNACESPIEQLMFVSVFEAFWEIRSFSNMGCAVFFQKNIECGEKTYRADFLIKAKKGNVEKSFVVECDGHDFHEKTKEQAKRDKQRDRDLLKNGYKVIHFTGSEIWNDYTACTKQLLEIIMSCFGVTN